MLPIHILICDLKIESEWWAMPRIFVSGDLILIWRIDSVKGLGMRPVADIVTLGQLKDCSMGDSLASQKKQLRDCSMGASLASQKKQLRNCDMGASLASQ